MPNILEQYAEGPVDLYHLAPQLNMAEDEVNMALLGLVSQRVGR
jgi:hypothetical protein